MCLFLAFFFWNAEDSVLGCLVEKIENNCLICCKKANTVAHWGKKVRVVRGIWVKFTLPQVDLVQSTLPQVDLVRYT